MAKESAPEIIWLPDVEDHDYPAAASYLSLLHREARVEELLAGLRSAPLVKFKAKDIFRASGLPHLDGENSHVANDLKKMAKGVSLSPLLLVRDEALGKVVIADGYHRMCAVYTLNEDAWIPCRIF